MNANHIQQIFKHYIDEFEKLNNSEHKEYYKWQIVKSFRTMMDEALRSENSEFAFKLLKVKKLTCNLVDNYTQPFQGIVYFAESEPETVKTMFKNLFVNSDKEMVQREAAIVTFLKKSHELRDKYFPGSYLYKDDMHSVTTYLFLYDPDHNYIFKSSNARVFADCIEFYDDWGVGDSVKLDVYYRMCDQVAEIAKRSSELMKTDASRFENGWGIDPQTFARDKEKHILVSDLIYCCLTYDLFGGITFKRKKVKEKQLIQEKKEKANRLEKELEDVQEEFQKLQEAMEYFDSIFEVGTNIRHKRYGLGTITARSDNIIEVAFIKGEKKKFGMIVSIINSIFSPQGVDCTEQMKKNIDILKRKTAIKSAVSYAEKNLSEYTEYLD